MATIWLTVNGLLVSGSRRVARRIDPNACTIERALHALVIGISVLIAGGITCGVAGILSGPSLIAVVGTLAIIGHLVAASGTELRLLSRAAERPVDLPVSRNAVATPSRGERIERRILMVVCVFVTAYLLAHMTLDGLLKFPTDFDSLMYHIPMIDEWLQARSLYAPDSAYWWSPGNSELLGLWCVAPFSGDFLIALNNLPTMALWVVATLSIGHSLELDRRWSKLAVLAVLAVHTSFLETDDASNDLALVAFFSSSAAYALRYARTGRRCDLVLGGLSLGLLLGVKYFSVGYLALVAGIWAAGTLLRRGLQPAIRDVFILGLAAAPTGAYWYVRNTIVSGSPIYPMGLTGSTPAVGYPINVSTTSLWGNPDPSRWGLAVGALWQMTGPCHYVAVLGLPLVVAWILGVALRSYRRAGLAPHCWNTVTLALLILGSGTIFLITPFSIEDQPGTLNHLRWAAAPARYGLSFLSFALIGWIVGLERFSTRLDDHYAAGTAAGRTPKRRFETIFAVLIAALIVWQWGQRLQYAGGELDVAYGLLLALSLALWAWILRLLYDAVVRRRFAKFAFWTAAITLAVIGVASVGQRWHAEFGQHYNGYFGTRLFTQLGKQYSKVDRICVLDLRIYPFFGSARERRVCRPRYVESQEWLIDYLRGHDLTLVATHRGRDLVFDMYRDVPAWLKREPELFREVLHGADHVIYHCEFKPDEMTDPQISGDVSEMESDDTRDRNSDPQFVDR